MYISKIRIKNYRIFGENEFELELKPFTLIIGENNIGKTNILNAIRLILSQDISLYRSRMLGVEDINKKTIQKFYEALRQIEDNEKVQFPYVLIELEFKLQPDDDEQKAVVGDWFVDMKMDTAKIGYKFKLRSGFNREKWIQQVKKNIEQDPSFKVEFPIREYDYEIYGGDNDTNKCEQYLLSLIKMDYLDALRDAHSELESNHSTNLIYRILDSIEHDNYSDIKNSLEQIDSTIKDNEALMEMKSEIKGLLNKISIDSENQKNVDFKFSTPDTKEMLKKISLGYGDDYLDISKNGLGSNNLLYISLMVSKFANKNYFGKDSVFRLIGIEEPEAHLHVQLQEHLSKNIKKLLSENNDNQIIMTTHSAQISGSLDIENTVVIYRDGDSIKNHYILDGFTDKAEDIRKKRFLMRYLDATKTPMFFARKIILVEGIAEQIVIPKLFEQEYKKTLVQIGCSVINVNGLAFRNFLDIIKNGYYLKCAVMTDGDKGTKTENRADKLIDDYKNYSNVIQINKNEFTFEKEFIKTNNIGNERKVILKAYKLTRPQNVKNYSDKYVDKDDNFISDSIIYEETIYKDIDEYKAEFAMNMVESIEKYSEINIFVKIPKYIKEAFEFIND